jgi:hypothetical protein
MADGERRMVHFINVPDTFQTISIVYKVSQSGALSVFTVGEEEGENNLMGLLETACLYHLAPRTSVST